MLHRQVAPSVPLISTADARTHLRQTYVDVSDGAKIDSLVAALTYEAEVFCNRGFLNQTWRYYADGFPTDSNEILLYKGPISAVSSVAFYDSVGNWSALETESFQADIISEPGRVKMAAGVNSWPTTQAGRVNSVMIEFVVGYGDTADLVPKGIREAILLQLGSLYTNREDEVMGTISTKLSRNCELALGPYRIPRFS